MELTISLAHFCDNHGPTSIICTQAQPVTCYTCSPPSTTSSFDDLRSAPKNFCPKKSQTSRTDGSFDFADAHDSTTPENTPATSSIPITQNAQADATTKATRPSSQNPSNIGGGISGWGDCINCALSLTPPTPTHLPTLPETPPMSTPTSPPSSPTLRTKTRVTVPSDTDSGYSSSASFDSSSPKLRGGKHLTPSIAASSSFGASSAKSTSTSRSHTHVQTYISTHAPAAQNTYSSLRRAIVRTLSGETLPKGQKDGRLYFDTHEGCVVAYTFRLRDRYARGGGRLYAFVALATGESAGVGGSGLLRVVNRLWRQFEAMAGWLGDKVAKLEESDGGHDHEYESSSSEEFVNHVGGGRRWHVPEAERRRVGGGSFLTTGYKSQAGRERWGINASSRVELKGRNLLEMTGDERVFAKVHMRFVEVLGELG